MRRLSNITNKPWGAFFDLADSKDKWRLKALVIKRGQQLSLQRHLERSELWVVVEGKIQVEKGNKVFKLIPQKSIFIKKKEAHRIKALTDAVVVEVSFGTHKERDIMRLADDYGRVSDSRVA